MCEYFHRKCEEQTAKETLLLFQPRSVSLSVVPRINASASQDACLEQNQQHLLTSSLSVSQHEALFLKTAYGKVSPVSWAS